jgi:hypothetical protein
MTRTEEFSLPIVIAGTSMEIDEPDSVLVTSEDIVDESLASVTFLEKSCEDEEEEKCIEKFYSSRCCQRECQSKIPRDIAIEMRQSFMESPEK